MDREETNPDLQSLKRMIQNLDDELADLKLFDHVSEINSYCDNMAADVMVFVESCVQHVNQLGKELLDQIDLYRQTRVEEFKSQASEHSTKAKLDLESLMAKVAMLEAEFSSTEQLASWRVQVDDHSKKIRRFKRRILEQVALSGQLMRFEPNELFIQSKEHLGQLLLNVESPNEITELGQKNAIISHWKDVFAVIFLDNERMASGSADTNIRIWTAETGQILGELTGHTGSVLALARMPNGWLASGCSDGDVKLWCISPLRLGKALRKTFNVADSSITSLQSLPGGLLACLDSSGSISIWGYISTPFCNRIIKSYSSLPRLDITSAGLLVTCSFDNISMWNPNRGTYDCVKTIYLGRESRVNDFCVLSNDRMAVSFANGSVKVVDIESGRVTMIMEDTPNEAVDLLYQLPGSDYMLSQRYGELQLWDLSGENGELVNRFKTCTTCIYALAVSPDRRLMATGSQAHLPCSFATLIVFSLI